MHADVKWKSIYCVYWSVAWQTDNQSMPLILKWQTNRKPYRVGSEVQVFVL